MNIVEIPVARHENPAVNTAYQANFSVVEASELKVTLIRVNDAGITEVIEPSRYAFTIELGQTQSSQYFNANRVTFTTLPDETNMTAILYRDTPLSSENAFAVGADNTLSTEGAIDKLTRITQDLKADTLNNRDAIIEEIVREELAKTRNINPEHYSIYINQVGSVGSPRDADVKIKDVPKVFDTIGVQRITTAADYEANFGLTLSDVKAEIDKLVRAVGLNVDEEDGDDNYQAGKVSVDVTILSITAPATASANNLVIPQLTIRYRLRGTYRKGTELVAIPSNTADVNLLLDETKASTLVLDTPYEPFTGEINSAVFTTANNVDTITRASDNVEKYILAGYLEAMMKHFVSQQAEATDTTNAKVFSFPLISNLESSDQKTGVIIDDDGNPILKDGAEQEVTNPTGLISGSDDTDDFLPVISTGEHTLYEETTFESSLEGFLKGRFNRGSRGLIFVGFWITHVFGTLGKITKVLQTIKEVRDPRSGFSLDPLTEPVDAFLNATETFRESLIKWKQVIVQAPETSMDLELQKHNGFVNFLTAYKTLERNIPAFPGQSLEDFRAFIRANVLPLVDMIGYDSRMIILYFEDVEVTGQGATHVPNLTMEMYRGRRGSEATYPVYLHLATSLNVRDARFEKAKMWLRQQEKTLQVTPSQDQVNKALRQGQVNEAVRQEHVNEAVTQDEVDKAVTDAKVTSAIASYISSNKDTFQSIVAGVVSEEHITQGEVNNALVAWIADTDNNDFQSYVNQAVTQGEINTAINQPAIQTFIRNAINTAVSNRALENNSVTTEKIADTAVTEPKLSEAVVGKLKTDDDILKLTQMTLNKSESAVLQSMTFTDKVKVAFSNLADDVRNRFSSVAPNMGSITDAIRSFLGSASVNFNQGLRETSKDSVTRTLRTGYSNVGQANATKDDSDYTGDGVAIDRDTADEFGLTGLIGQDGTFGVTLGSELQENDTPLLKDGEGINLLRYSGDDKHLEYNARLDAVAEAGRGSRVDPVNPSGGNELFGNAVAGVTNEIRIPIPSLGLTSNVESVSILANLQFRGCTANGSHCETTLDVANITIPVNNNGTIPDVASTQFPEISYNAKGSFSHMNINYEVKSNVLILTPDLENSDNVDGTKIQLQNTSSFTYNYTASVAHNGHDVWTKLNDGLTNANVVVRAGDTIVVETFPSHQDSDLTLGEVVIIRATPEENDNAGELNDISFKTSIHNFTTLTAYTNAVSKLVAYADPVHENRTSLINLPVDELAYGAVEETIVHGEELYVADKKLGYTDAEGNVQELGANETTDAPVQTILGASTGNSTFTAPTITGSGLGSWNNTTRTLTILKDCYVSGYWDARKARNGWVTIIAPDGNDITHTADRAALTLPLWKVAKNDTIQLTYGGGNPVNYGYRFNLYEGFDTASVPSQAQVDKSVNNLLPTSTPLTNIQRVVQRSIKGSRHISTNAQTHSILTCEITPSETTAENVTYRVTGEFNGSTNGARSDVYIMFEARRALRNANDDGWEAWTDLDGNAGYTAFGSGNPVGTSWIDTIPAQGSLNYIIAPNSTRKMKVNVRMAFWSQRARTSDDAYINRDATSQRTGWTNLVTYLRLEEIAVANSANVSITNDLTGPDAE